MASALRAINILCPFEASTHVSPSWPRNPTYRVSRVPISRTYTAVEVDDCRVAAKVVNRIIAIFKQKDSCSRKYHVDWGMSSLPVCTLTEIVMPLLNAMYTVKYLSCQKPGIPAAEGRSFSTCTDHDKPVNS
jgi:hypothetical protein